MLSILILILPILLLIILTFLNKKYHLNKGSWIKELFYFCMLLVAIYAITGVILLLQQLPLTWPFLFILFAVLLIYFFLSQRFDWARNDFFRYLSICLAVFLCLTGIAKTTADFKADTKAVLREDAIEQKKEREKQAEAKKEKALENALKNKWQQTLKGHPGTNADIALYSKKEDRTFTLTRRPNNDPFYTASILKVSILAQLLHLEQKKELTLTDDDKERAQAMIIQSDNDSATYFMTEKLHGYDGTRSLFHALHMKDSEPDLTAWGTSTTSAADQILLLNKIFFKNNFLSDNNRNYIKSLMGNIEADQNWGISAINDTDVQLKNGWLTLYDTGSVVNSIGHVTLNGSDYTVAILTNNSASQEEGEQLVEQLATDIKETVPSYEK